MSTERKLYSFTTSSRKERNLAKVNELQEMACNVLFHLIKKRASSQNYSDPWRSKMWGDARKYILGLPVNVKKLLFRKVFPEEFEEYQEEGICASRNSTTLTCEPPVIFCIWWLFTDDEGSEFLPMPDQHLRDLQSFLVKYLSRVRTSISKVTLQYNWILKKDFIRSLQNLPNLRHLTIMENKYVTNNFLSMIAEHCTLFSFEMRGVGSVDFITSDSLLPSAETVAKFLRSQSPTIQKIDLRFWSTNGLQADFDMFFKSAKNLEHIIYDWKFPLPIDLKSPPIPNIKHLKIHGGYNKFYDEVVDVEIVRIMNVVHVLPNLETISCTNITLPSVEDLESANLPADGRSAQEVLDHIVSKFHTVSLQVTDGHDLTVLKDCPVLRRLHLQIHGWDVKDEYVHISDLIPSNFDVRAFNWPNLTHLSINEDTQQSRCLSVHYLKKVIGSSPALKRFALTTRKIRQFEEHHFVEFLNECKLKHLEYLHINIFGHANYMTGRTILAFLRNSLNLKRVTNILTLRIRTLQEEQELVREGMNQGLRPIYAWKIGQDRWETEDGHIYQILTDDVIFE